MYCPKCQNKIERYMEACNKCGRRFNERDLGLLRMELEERSYINEGLREVENPAYTNEEHLIIDTPQDEEWIIINDDKTEQSDSADGVGEISVSQAGYDQEEIDEEEDEFDFYLNRIKELEIQNRNLRRKCEDLQQSISDSPDNIALESRIQALSEENDDLRLQNQDLIEKIKRIKREKEDINIRIGKMEEIVYNYESIISAVREAVGISDESYLHTASNNEIEENDSEQYSTEMYSYEENSSSTETEDNYITPGEENDFICPNCKKIIRKGIDFCTKCGYDLRKVK